MNPEVTLELLKRKCKEIKNRKELLEDSVANTSKQLVKLQEIKEILTKVLYIKKQEMRLLEEVVNAGLKYVYPDEEQVFKIEFVEKNRRVVPEFILNDAILKPNFIGSAGGVLGTISLFLFITFVKLENKKIVLLDEVDSQVDPAATNRLFEFLDSFAKDSNLTVVCISHKDLEFEYGMITKHIKKMRVV